MTATKRRQRIVDNTAQWIDNEEDLYTHALSCVATERRIAVKRGRLPSMTRAAARLYANVGRTTRDGLPLTLYACLAWCETHYAECVEYERQQRIDYERRALRLVLCIARNPADHSIDIAQQRKLLAESAIHAWEQSIAPGGDIMTATEYTVEIVRDEHMSEPWKEHDGHGEVSDWTSRDKRPSELVLCRGRGSARFYDFSQACRIALCDGWDSEPFNKDGRETPRQQAAKAARADYEHLRAWCADEWQWVGVVVRPKGACPTCGPCASLWGLKSSDQQGIDLATEDLKAELEEEEPARAALDKLKGKA